ncbi:hypothetical protein C8A00DRAFT_16285 [Chaetomidium leptoderma]|uniref:Clr5 domain-containing protein n=1 Tax=Chaetomidium leptoderma TaxID=669021 RepID=A0AAN6ZW66_9PEZI|nr:hypothetical protein C8A00DRAFT_16285 [Chaetomidium leptoderma]
MGMGPLPLLTGDRVPVPAPTLAPPRACSPRPAPSTPYMNMDRRVPQEIGGPMALLAAAENVTGLVLDDGNDDDNNNPEAFIKEEPSSPATDDDNKPAKMQPMKFKSPSPTHTRPPQRLLSAPRPPPPRPPAGKAGAAHQRFKKHMAKGGGPSRVSHLKQGPGQPSIPRRIDDWEPWKNVLYELYITQNRILRDIIGIMETKHNIRATPKMYKNQFARWGFFKYAIKGRPWPKAESPTGQSSSDDSLDGAIMLSRDDLLHADDGSRSMQAGLTAVRSFIYGHVDLDPSNRMAEEVAGFVDPCYRYFKVAMDLFDLKENLDGGQILRLAFLQIERKMSNPTMKSFSDLCLLVPHLLLESGRKDILSAYLNYVSRLATIKYGKHPVAELAASFAALVEDRPEDIMRYIMLLSRLNSDTIAALPGMLDRNRQWAHNQYLACQRTSALQPWGGNKDRHDHHMIRLEAQSVHWAQKLIMDDPESDEMATQWLNRRFEPEFGLRCEAYLTRFKEKVARDEFPAVFARMMECLYVGWLYDYYETAQEWDRAFEWGRRGLELCTDEQYAIWSIHLEQLMRRYGRPEEAEDLERKRREHSWLEKVRLEVNNLSIA